MKVAAGRRLARAMSGVAIVGVVAILTASAGVAVAAPGSPAPLAAATTATAATAATADTVSSSSSAHTADTAAIDQAASACATNPASADAATGTRAAVPPFDTKLLYAAPLLALDAACQALSDASIAADPGLRVDRLLDIAESALRAGRLDAAQRLFEALLRDAGNRTDVIAGDRLARLHVGRADLANAQADTPVAQRHFLQAQAALETAGKGRTLRQVAVWVGEATAWRHERLPGSLDRAAQALDQATALLASLDESVSLDMSRVLNERTMLAYARLDLAGTVELARAEVALYRQLGLADSAAPLDALITLGGVLSQLGRHDEAGIELREAMRLVDLHPDEQPAAALGVLNNYATLQSDRGRPADELAVADRAIAYARRAFGAGAARTVTPLTIRGHALSRLGRYGEARQMFEEALAVTAVHAAGLGPLRRLRLQEALATTLIALGETTAAEELIAQGLQETSALEGLDFWRGRLLRLRAAMAARRGDWTAADAAITEAIARIGAVNGERHPYVIDMWSMRCFAQTQGRLPGHACVDLAAALHELDAAAPGYRFNAMTALAQDDDNHDRPDSALTHRLQALAAAESAATPDPLWSAYAALALQVRGQGVKQLAILLGKQAIEQIERMRASLDADLKRNERGFLADKLVVYRRLADWLTEDGRIDEALDVIRLLKEEEFFDFVNRDGGLLGRSDRGRAYAEAEVPLQRPWQAATGALAASAGGDTTTALRRENERVTQWAGLLRQFAAPRSTSASPGGSAPRTSLLPPATPPATRASPAVGEARVWIYSGDQRLHLVIDGPSHRTTTSIAVPPTDIAKLVTELLVAVERREPVLERLQALHAWIGAPIERAVATDGVQRIVLTVDGPLRYLPFAALHDGRGFISERYSVEQRLPTPNIDAAAAEQMRPATLRVQAMGVSRSLAGLTPLNEVANEVCGIVAGPVLGLARDVAACGGTGVGRGVVGGSGWMNEEFTADRLQTVIADGHQRRAEANLLHIGTHFVLRPGRMSRSWLLLGHGRPLSLDDLARLDFSGESLVTLSACETGIGSAQWGGSGEEIDGLGGLMLRRGAGGVVASLWRVDDASTSRLMQAFYRQLAIGTAPAEALQRAQAQLRDAGGREAQPFYWAGFYLVTGAD